jgi:hypothetical protein
MEFITYVIVHGDEIDFNNLTEEAEANAATSLLGGGRPDTGVLVYPSSAKRHSIYEPLKINVLTGDQGIMFFAPSRGKMVSLMKGWEKHMKKSGHKDWIATKWQLSVCFGAYGSMLPVTPVGVRIVAGTIQTAAINVKPLMNRIKIKFKRAVGKNSSSDHNLNTTYNTYSPSEAKRNWAMDSIMKGGFYCFVGQPNPLAHVTVHGNGKKAFTMSDIASFIQRG